MRRVNRNIANLSCSIMLLAGSATMLLPTSQAFAATVQPEADREQELELLRDFIHFVKIARFDVAADLGNQILDAGLSTEEFVDIIELSREQQRFEEAVAAGMRVPVLEPIAAKLDGAFRDGKLARARNPEEIARNIELLTQGLRARSMGRERLITAGEYAMPQLLDAYLQQKDLALKAQVQRLLVDMGRHAIVPLTTAMGGLDAVRQEAIAEVLGLIPYRTSLPTLIDLYQSTDNDAVRQACGRAISRLGGNPSSNVADMYALLADSYYAQPAELTSFPDEDYQLVWNFDRGLGLVMVPVQTPVFMKPWRCGWPNGPCGSIRATRKPSHSGSHRTTHASSTPKMATRTRCIRPNAATPNTTAWPWAQISPSSSCVAGSIPAIPRSSAWRLRPCRDRRLACTLGTAH